MLYMLVCSLSLLLTVTALFLAYVVRTGPMMEEVLWELDRKKAPR